MVPRRLGAPRQRVLRRGSGLRPRPEKCASLLSTKNQNGLRNQFHLSPYKPPTAQCESAQKIQNPKKSETTQQPKQQTKPAKPPNALSRTTQKTPKFTPDSNPENPKNNPCQHTPHYIYYLSHQPNYQHKPYRKSTDTQPVSRTQN